MKQMTFKENGININTELIDIRELSNYKGATFESQTEANEDGEYYVIYSFEDKKLSIKCNLF